MTTHHPENGPWLPTGRVVAVFDRHVDADGAIQLLKAKGVHAGRIHLLEGQEGADLLDTECEDCAAFTRMMRFVWSVLSVEAEQIHSYAAQVAAGRALVGVHAKSAADVELARSSLASNGGYNIEHFSEAATATRLPS